MRLENEAEMYRGEIIRAHKQNEDGDSGDEGASGLSMSASTTAIVGHCGVAEAQSLIR